MSYDFTCSKAAFTEAKEGVELKRAQVLAAIKKLGPCTDKQIAAYLGWEINRITPRRGELVTALKIYSAYKAKSDKRTVNHWAVVKCEAEGEQINLF